MRINRSLTATQVTDSGEILFEELFRTHWDRLNLVLHRMISDPDEAEDLCLQAFCQLRKKMNLLRSWENLAGWLYRTATNLGLNAIRAGRRRTWYERLAYDFYASKMDDPAENVEINQEREMVQKILAELKPREAQILLLRYSGLNYAELAAACQISPSSVGTILARAEREFEKRFKARFGG